MTSECRLTFFRQNNGSRVSVHLGFVRGHVVNPAAVHTGRGLLEAFRYHFFNSYFVGCRGKTRMQILPRGAYVPSGETVNTDLKTADSSVMVVPFYDFFDFTVAQK